MLVLDTMFTKIAKHSRRVRVGDLFGLHVVKLGWIPFRVAVENASVQAGGGLFVIYIYRHVIKSDSSAPPRIEAVGSMSLADLLLPPTLVSKQLWNDGYAVYLGNAPFSTSEFVAKHCFENRMVTPSVYFDENANLIARTQEHVGLHRVAFPTGLWQRTFESLSKTHASGMDRVP